MFFLYVFYFYEFFTFSLKKRSENAYGSKGKKLQSLLYDNGADEKVLESKKIFSLFTIG